MTTAYDKCGFGSLMSYEQSNTHDRLIRTPVLRFAMRPVVQCPVRKGHNSMNHDNPTPDTPNTPDNPTPDTPGPEAHGPFEGTDAPGDAGTPPPIDATPPTVPADDDQSRMWATFVHLSALSALLGIPLGHILGPLILWLIKKDEMPFVNAHGKEALNFGITFTIYALIAGATICIFIGFVLLPIVIIFWIIFAIIAAVAANKGEMYHYPLTIRFIS